MNRFNQCADQYEKTEINFCKAMAAPTFTYGSEIWAINRTRSRNEILGECDRLRKETPDKYKNQRRAQLL
jgi:ABC-type transporter lipoprotein component MlaA